MKLTNFTESNDIKLHSSSEPGLGYAVIYGVGLVIMASITSFVFFI